MTRRRKLAGIAACLAALHLVVLFAGFFAPYDPTLQDRDRPFAPPTRIHFIDARGGLHAWPFVYLLQDDPKRFGEYVESTEKVYPLNFFVRAARYELLGVMNCNLHFVGVDEPARLFPLGTDGYGRDVYSRLLFGGQVSLFAGVLATILALSLGTLLGVVAGYFGGAHDAIIMRGVELFLALPWLYLLFAIRAFLPLSLNPTQTFLLLIGVIGLIGWARPARLIRGITLSARERPFVLAARLFGGSDAYIIRRHILPENYAVILTQAALLIPQYILAEVTLSFLGLGVGEPAASWGSMLSSLQQYSVLVNDWWMLMPGLALVPIFWLYLLLSSELQEWAA